MNNMLRILCVSIVLATGVALAADVPSDIFAPPPNPAPNPVLMKLPFSFSGCRMENTPVMYEGKSLLVQNVRPLNTKAKDFYLFIEDLRTGGEITRLGESCSFVSAFVNGNEMNVFGTENTDDDWTHDIYRFSSTNLKDWKKELAITRKPGEHLFNTSVCRDDQGYVMAFESNLPVQWSFRFARSKDLSKWEEVEGIQMSDIAGKTALANPCIRYFAPYYYVVLGAWRWTGPGLSYVYRLESTKYITMIVRSKDLATWEVSPTKEPMLDPIEGEGINNTDADLFEYEGNTYVYYATGDQATWGTIRVAMHPGPLKEFLESYFPDGVPKIIFDARKGAYTGKTER